MNAARSTTTRVTPGGVVAVVVVVVVPARRRPADEAAADDASEAACCAARSSSLAACWTFSIGDGVGVPRGLSTAWRSFCATTGRFSISAVADSFHPPQPITTTIVLSTTAAPMARGRCQRSRVSTTGVSA